MTDPIKHHIVVYDPRTCMINYTIEEPYPAGLIELYDQLKEDREDFAWFEQPMESIFDKYVHIEGDVITLQEREPTPGEANTYSITLGEMFSIAGLHDNTTIQIDGTTYNNETDSVLEIEPASKGTYRVSFHKFPYKENVIFLEVT